MIQLAHACHGFYYCPFEFHQEISSEKGDIARFCYVATYGAT